MTYDSKFLINSITTIGILPTLESFDIELIEDQTTRIICRTLLSSKDILMEKLSEDLKDMVEKQEAS